MWSKFIGKIKGIRQHYSITILENILKFKSIRANNLYTVTAEIRYKK
jgi:hypothetical protein